MSLWKTRDRTRELKNAERSDDEGTTQPGTSTGKEEENEILFRKVQEIHEGLESFRRKVTDLENKQKTVLGVALPENDMKKELQTLRAEIKTMASQFQKKLKTIEPKKGADDGTYVSINMRMQRTQHGVLSMQFRELMGHCYTIQSEYRDRNVERIQRQLKIAGNNVTDEELDAMLETGQTDVFTQNILIDAKAPRQALNEIESRHDEILNLERSMRDLHDMFQYLAMQVEAQGEKVNNIESNTIQSSNSVGKATGDLGKAVEYKSCT